MDIFPVTGGGGGTSQPRVSPGINGGIPAAHRQRRTKYGHLEALDLATRKPVRDVRQARSSKYGVLTDRGRARIRRQLDRVFSCLRRARRQGVWQRRLKRLPVRAQFVRVNGKQTSQWAVGGVVSRPSSFAPLGRR